MKKNEKTIFADTCAENKPKNQFIFWGQSTSHATSCFDAEKGMPQWFWMKKYYSKTVFDYHVP